MHYHAHTFQKAVLILQENSWFATVNELEQ